MLRREGSSLSELVPSLREDLHHRRPATLVFTGEKGLAAEHSARRLAGQLGRSLLRIDLSAVVSKYIGETEKNLERLFERAQASDAVLFFDEADALFGSRTDVKDAHDRYSNLEVNFLLQRLELYPGIVVLCLLSDDPHHRIHARRRRVVIPHPSG
jgi:SpoVK/Ycf46/Vps4 family AAA+-type ATPase